MFEVICDILLSVLVFLLSILLFIDGYKSYRYQRVTKSNPKLDRDRLVDIKGYTQWYGKRMMAAGAGALMALIIGWVGYCFTSIQFTWMLCMSGNMIIIFSMMHLQNSTKIDQFYDEK